MWLVLGILVVTLIILLRKFSGSGGKTDFWDKLGVPTIDITKIASSFELLLGIKNEVEIDKVVYDKLGNHKFCGIVEAGNPILIVKDLDLAKCIMIKDFDHFVDRRNLFSNSKSKVLLKMLPSLFGTEWKGVRTAMSPTFTTGKIRRIMEFFNKCGAEWVSNLKSKSEAGASVTVNLKETTGQYAVDVIAAAVFGLNAGTIKDPDSPFLRKTEKLGDTSSLTVFKQSLALRFPALFKLLNIGDTMDGDMLQFFDDMLGAALHARESGAASPRNDFLQLMVEARKGVVKAEGSDELTAFEKEAVLHDEVQKERYLRDEDVVKGQAFVFFFAGYHGIAMTLTYALHALACYPDIQAKLRDELKGKFQADGSIDYDVVNALTYMEMFLSEVLRYYTISPRFSRQCTREYDRPDIGLKLPKGTFVEIPVARIHKDPKYFSDPEKFDPEKFNQENKAKRHPYAYMPFGLGPRNCIGMRFALVEVKTAIALVVNNFWIDKMDSTKFPIQTKLVGHALQIPEKIEVKLRPHDTN